MIPGDGENGEHVVAKLAEGTSGAIDEVADGHDTLKYSLLGPSLTKAGQDGVDQQKISEIIYNASKGSRYFNREQKRDDNLTIKIAQITAKRCQLQKLDLAHDLRRADELIAQLELSRVLTQYIVHIDCDAFYAAVEELDRPDLSEVPFAVGKGVLTTCNYHARKFGCRSGMAGFVAMKLCPQLICLPLNFAKYTAKAEEVRAVLSTYDPRFESASIDEAYLNITTYCEEHGMSPEEAVSRMRAEVHEKTKITVSAGIAPNTRIAKIASNMNKPNGQYRVQSDRASVMAFMAGLPCRKVNGVGRVFERELAEVGIKTCADVYPQRAYLAQLFGHKAAHFLLQTYLGIGRTSVQPAEEYERKSIGTESTFADMGDPTQLREKLMHIAEELEGDCERVGFKGRTLCLKIKLHTYEVFSRQVALPFAIWKRDDLFKYSLPMLTKLEKELPAIKLRLMGLRVTHLVSMKKSGADFFGRHKVATPNPARQTATDEEGWELWPEAEFEAAVQQEKEEQIEEVERLSQEHESYAPPLSTQRKHGRILNEAPSSEKTDANGESPYLPCPVCSTLQPADDRLFNEHIDLCLSRQTIREVVKNSASSVPESSTSGSQNQGVAASKKSLSAGSSQKRGRPKKSDHEADQRNSKKRAFFT